MCYLNAFQNLWETVYTAISISRRHTEKWGCTGQLQEGTLGCALPMGTAMLLEMTGRNVKPNEKETSQ